MNNIKSILENLKIAIPTIGMILSLIWFIGKPYADEYIDKRVDDKMKEYVKAQKETSEKVDKLANILILSMDKKQREELEKLQKEKKALLGN